MGDILSKNSPVSSSLLTRMAARGFRVVPSTACPSCDGAGYTTSPGLVIGAGPDDNQGQQVYIELPRRVPCTDCGKGLEALLDWQDAAKCDCTYGQRTRQVDPEKPWLRLSEFCTQCEDGRLLSAKVEARLKELKQARLERSFALTPQLREKTFQTFTGDSKLFEIRRAVYQAARERASLLLTGDTGIGKSHLAAAYLNYRIGQGDSGIFVSLVDLMACLKKTIRNQDGPDWEVVLSQFVEAEILVLDDLGQEKATDKVIEVVFHLLNSRINAGRPTVVTTNYSLYDLVDVCGYTPAIKSRLAGFERIAWEAEDYRLKRS